MNVVPSGSVTFCKGVKLSKNNQRDFKSKQEQQQYFAEREWYKADKVQFIRAQGDQWSGQIKVPTQYYRLYTCNYLFYSNAGFNDKIFYCYITGVDYIDTATTRVQFVVDLYQQFLFEYKIDRATVVRKHHSVADTNNNENYIGDIYIAGNMDCSNVSTVNTWLDEGLQHPDDDAFVLIVGFRENKFGELVLGNQNVIFNNDFFAGCVCIWDLRNYSEDTALNIQQDIRTITTAWNIEFAYIYPNINGMFTSNETQYELKPFHCRYLHYQNGFYYRSGYFDTGVDLNAPAKMQQDPYVKYTLAFNNGDGISNININQCLDRQKLEYTLVPRIMEHPQITLYLKNYNGKNTFEYGNFKINSNFKCTTTDFKHVMLSNDSIVEIAEPLIQMTKKGLQAVVGFNDSQPQIQFSKINRAVNNNSIASNRNSDISNIDSNKINLRKEPQVDLDRLNFDKTRLQLKKDSVENEGRPLVPLLEYNGGPVDFRGNTVGGQWVSGYVFQYGLYRYESTTYRDALEYIKRYGLSCFSMEIWKPCRQRYDFVECQDIVINGDIPQEAKAYIGQMFTEGVMFWHDNNLFDYSNNGDA